MATLTNRLLSIRDAVEIHSADGSRVLTEVKKQLVSLTHGARINVAGLQFPLEVRGDFRGRNFEVRCFNSIANPGALDHSAMYVCDVSTARLCRHRHSADSRCSAVVAIVTVVTVLTDGVD